MTDQNRWSEDRYGDRYRQDDYRNERYRAGAPYARNYGQDRHADRGYGESGYADRGYGQAYGARYEERSFAGSERGYEPYGSTYGEELYRDRSYGTEPRDYRAYDGRTRDARGYEDRNAALHQGYRAPFGGVHGDAQGYTNDGYGRQAGYRGDGRYGYTEYRPDDGRGNYGAFGYASPSRIPNRAAYGEERGWWDQTRDEVSSWFGDDQAVQRRQFDEARHGARDSVHRGRGPKGYTRSDDRIREDVNDRLTDDHFLDASEVEVRVANGEVTLTGHVAHRDAKRRAEDLADHVAGVKHVQNNLRVQEQHASGGAGSVAASQATAAQTGVQAAAAKSN